MVGMIMTGIFASKAINGAVVDEGLYFGTTTLFVNHMIALVLVSVFAFVLSFVLLKVTDMILPLRVSEADEKVGLDMSQHNESLLENVDEEYTEPISRPVSRIMEPKGTLA
jgi:Amt family ammonium transporter